MKQIAVAILSLRSNIPITTGKRIPVALKRIAVVLLFLVLCLAEIFKVYFVMPFPGSQHSRTIDIAYWLTMHIGWIRILTLAAISIALIRVFKTGRNWEKLSSCVNG